MYTPSAKQSVYSDGNILSVYTDHFADDFADEYMPSVYTDRFWDGIISVGNNYRQKKSVGNSFSFLRFSGSVSLQIRWGRKNETVWYLRLAIQDLLIIKCIYKGFMVASNFTVGFLDWSWISSTLLIMRKIKLFGNFKGWYWENWNIVIQKEYCWIYKG